MTDIAALPAFTRRAYTRAAGEVEETVHVTIDQQGYIRMKADNLHDVLLHLGFTETTKEA